MRILGFCSWLPTDWPPGGKERPGQDKAAGVVADSKERRGHEGVAQRWGKRCFDQAGEALEHKQQGGKPGKAATLLFSLSG